MVRVPLWQHQEIEQACKGVTFNSQDCYGVAIDSRILKNGDLFIAIPGPVTDGHHYVDHAVAQGAAGIIVNYDQPEWQHYPRFIVSNSEQTLQHLARIARNRTQAKIIGITGSFGKTSIKDALYHLLKALKLRVTATQRSFNNHWGVPLTLANLHQDDQFGIFEMGMNHTGELNHLSTLVQPDIALINNVGLMHQANFDGIESIAYAKAEIFKGMKPGATVILNRDFGPFELLREQAYVHHLRVLSFSCKDSTAEFYLEKAILNDQGQTLHVRTPYGIITVHLSMTTQIWHANTMALLGLLYASGFDLKKTQFDFQSITPGPGRGQIHKVDQSCGAVIVIDESYNAGPDSMRAALISLAKYPQEKKGRRIAILGDMLELGPSENMIHADFAKNIQELAIDQVYCCGPLMKNLYDALPAVHQGYWAITPQEVWPYIAQSIKANDVFMIKGSRGQRAYEGRMAYFVNQLINLKL